MCSGFKNFHKFADIIYRTCCRWQISIKFWIKKCTLTPFVALEIPLEGNALAKMEKQQLVSPWRQCSNTPVGIGQGFLSKEQCDNTEASPILSNLTPANFYLFLRLKVALKGRRFCDAFNIVKNATEELKMLSRNGFEEWFQHLYSRWQKRIVAEGDCFEGKTD